VNCREVQEQMSAYHDGELSELVSVQVEAHVNSCQECSEQLRAFRELTRLSATLRAPFASRDAWPELSAEIGHSQRITPAFRFRITTPSLRWASAAALILVCGLVVLVLALQSYHSHNLSEAFDHFLVAFSRSPSQADDVLSNLYNGQRVTAMEAERLLKYRPAVYQGLPAGYSLNSAYVMKMPCCTCFQANLISEDGGGIAVFEHDGEQQEWFGDRASTEVICQGQPTRIVQADSYISASCPCGPRYLTIVGAKDVEQLDSLLASWLPTAN
jgi:hypothetical protein